jgi:hypothetical protein
MPNALMPIAVALIALLLAGPGLAETNPAPRTLDTTNSTSLSPEKQERVKEFIRRHDQLKGTDPLPRSQETFTPGAKVPDSIALVALPEDRTTEVPQVTTYQFFLAANGIVVVDPNSRQVVQVIP